jgi:hypothetical protein
MSWRQQAHRIPIARVPFAMVETGGNGFFDPDTGPPAFYGMSDELRQASIGVRYKVCGDFLQ